MILGSSNRWGARSAVRQILGGSAISLGVRIIGVGLSYVANILISRFLGLAGYGQYAIALGWALVLVLPARLGFDYSALRYVTAYVETGNSGALRGFVRVSIGSVTCFSLLIGAVMATLTYGATSDVGSLTIAAAATLIAPISVVGILSVMMRVAQRYFASQFYDQVMRPASLILLLGLGAALGLSWNAPAAMLLTAIAAWLSVGALGLHFRKAFAAIWSERPRYDELRKWFILSLPLLGVTIAQELLNQLEIILLGALADARSAGLFAAAARLVSLMTFALGAFGIVSGPMVASAYRRRDWAELQSITSYTTRLGLLFAAVVALALFVAGKWLLSLFGPEFQGGYLPLMILTAGGLVNAFTGIVVYLATLTDRERPALLIFLLALALSFALNMLLIPRLGVIGAAIASSSALSFWNIAMLLYVRRVMGIDASAFGLRSRIAR